MPASTLGWATTNQVFSLCALIPLTESVANLLSSLARATSSCTQLGADIRSLEQYGSAVGTESAYLGYVENTSDA